jgi:predicted small secreted protein
MKRGLMRRTSLWVAALLLLAALSLAGCQRGGEDVAAADEPAMVEPVEGSDDLLQVTLTADAAERIDLQTAVVRTQGKGAAERTILPYSAIVYETDGETWVYTSTRDLSFVREHIAVQEIEGDRAVLSEGPPAGTEVVTVGVAELFGAEHGIGADDGH